MLSACVCTFRRKRNSKSETGIAITTAPGLHQTVVIIPREATTIADVLYEVWTYTLHFHLGSFVLPREKDLF